MKPETFSDAWWEKIIGSILIWNKKIKSQLHLTEPIEEEELYDKGLSRLKEINEGKSILSKHLENPNLRDDVFYKQSCSGCIFKVDEMPKGHKKLEYISTIHNASKCLKYDKFLRIVFNIDAPDIGSNIHLPECIGKYRASNPVKLIPWPTVPKKYAIEILRMINAPRGFAAINKN